MELCDTEWLWTLGDDDRIWDDAVEKVLKGIDNNRDCTCVNFAQITDNRTKALTTCGRTAFLSVLGRHFGSLMFLPCSVYRMEAILPSLMYGYLQIPSSAPHLAVLLMALDTSETVHFSANIIVERLQAQKGPKWSTLWVELGIPLLLDLPFGSGDRFLLRNVLRSRLRFKTLLAAYVNVLCYGWRIEDLTVCYQLFNIAALRRLTVTGSLYESVLIFVFQVSLLVPRVALLVTQILFRAVRGQPMQEWASSVGLGPV
jgi:hypothetical protein